MWTGKAIGPGWSSMASVPVVAEVTPAAVDELRLDEGGDVWVAVKATEIGVFPA